MNEEPFEQVPSHQLHELIEIYDFMRTFKKQLQIPFEFNYIDLYNSLKSEQDQYSNLSEYLLVQCYYLIYRQLISDVKIINSNYHRLLEQTQQEILIKQFLKSTWNIFFQEIPLIFKTKMLFKKLEGTDVWNRFSLIQEQNSEVINFYQLPYEDKIKLYKFLINYVFRECQFIEDFMEEQKVIALYLTISETKYSELQKSNAVQAKLTYSEISEQEKLIKNYTNSRKQSDRFEEQKIQSKIKVLEGKARKLEIIMNNNYKEVSLFNVGYVCSMAGESIRETYYVLKNHHDLIFHKKVLQDNTIIMHTIRSEVILQLQQNLKEVIQRIQAHNATKIKTLQELGYLQELQILQPQTDFESLFSSLDLYYEKQEEKQLQNIMFDFRYLSLLVVEFDYQSSIVEILLDCERIFHEFVTKYLHATWARPEKRQDWIHELKEATKLVQFNEFVGKFPGQLFNVNTRFMDPDSERSQKSRGFEIIIKILVFWFYSKQALSISFKGLLAQNAAPYNILYCLCLTLYVTLLNYVHKQTERRKLVDEATEEVPNKRNRVIKDSSDSEIEFENYKYKGKGR